MKYKKNCLTCGFLHPTDMKCGEHVRECEDFYCHQCGKPYTRIYVDGKPIATMGNCMHEKNLKDGE